MTWIAFVVVLLLCEAAVAWSEKKPRIIRRRRKRG